MLPTHMTNCPYCGNEFHIGTTHICPTSSNASEGKYFTTEEEE